LSTIYTYRLNRSLTFCYAVACNEFTDPFPRHSAKVASLFFVEKIRGELFVTFRFGQSEKTGFYLISRTQGTQRV